MASRTTSSSFRLLTILGGTLALGALALLGRADEKPTTAEPTTPRLTSRPRPTAPAQTPLKVGDAIKTDAGQRRRVLLPDGSVLFINQNSRVKFDADRRLVLDAGEIFVEAAAEPLTVKTAKREVSGQAARFEVRVADDGTSVEVLGGRVKVSGLDDPLRAGQRLAAADAKPQVGSQPTHLLDWTRDLIAAAEAPLVPRSQHAGGALLVNDPDGDAAKLGLRKYHVDVFIEDGFARTTIDQTYFNHTPRRLEGTFYFPLPPDASLSRLAMYVDGQLMEGGMAERDYARGVYEEIVYQQKDPALLEWVDGSTFKMRVFPLEARQEKRIVLSYTQQLSSQFGRLQYRFPAGHSLGTVQNWSLHAAVKNGTALDWNSPSHTLKAGKDGTDLLLDASAKDVKLDRDVVLSLDEKKPESLRFSTSELAGAKYLMLRYRPEPLAASPVKARRDWVFLFESSGDRDPLLARAQIEIVRSLLSQAEPDDTFTILAAGTRVRALASELRPVTPENVQAAVAFLEGIHLIGALDLNRALTEAEPLLKAGKNPCLVHVGSGIPALGERRADILARKVSEGARYVGIGVGRRWNRGFMKAAAERTAGFFTQINPDESISWRVFELAAGLDAPRLLNVQVADAAGKAVFLGQAASVAQGEEVTAIARLEPGTELPESVKITATLAGRPFERTLPVKDARPKADYLPRTWARLEIERLLAEDAAKHKDKIVALSKAMVVMTPFTSLLVLENEAMYEQYKVDRARKDRWALYGCPAKIPVVYEPLPGMPPDPREQAKNAKPTAKQVLETVILGRQSTQKRARYVTETDLEHYRSIGLSAGIEASPGTNLVPEVTGFGGTAGATLARTRPPGDMFVRGLNDAENPGPAFNAVENPDVREDIRFRDTYGYQGKLLKPLPTGGLAGLTWTEAAPGTIGQILVVGNDVTRQNVILRQVPLYAGQVLTYPTTGEARTGSLLFGAGVNGDSGLTGSLARLELFQEGTIEAPRSNLPAFVTERMEDKYLYNVERILGVTLLSANTVNQGSKDSALLYRRPSYDGNDRIFFDLVAYAPGMGSTWADVLAVVEAETAPSPRTLPGSIDPAARKLLDQARPKGWQALTLPAAHGRPALTIAFDGTGRYAWERTLPPGIRERVVCDGKTILHLYPDLGIGARRTVSRFHRADFARLVPWALPLAEDLARGGDLKAVAERTVAVVPHGIDKLKDKDGKPVSYVRVQFVFAADGRLSERQLVEVPKNKVLLREVLAGDGIRILDADGKELSSRKLTLAAAEEPDLRPDLAKLLVLPLPYRTSAHLNAELTKAKKDLTKLPSAEALPLFAAFFAEGNGEQAYQTFQRYFHARERRQIGFYVLLASCGYNLDAEHGDVLAAHADEPLGQYLALYSSPVLRKHASQWAVTTNQWADGFLKHLAVTHALYQRWGSERALTGSETQRQTDFDKALEYVRRQKGSPYGWALLTLVQDRALKEGEAIQGQAEKLGKEETERRMKAVRSRHKALVEAFALFEEAPGLRYAARYEKARSLLRAGDADAARKQFTELYEQTVAKDALPLIDGDFRWALLAGDKQADPWGELIRKTGARFVEKKYRVALLLLARQCWQLDDAPLANHLAAAVLEKCEPKEKLGLTLAVVAFQQETGQFAEADQLVQGLLQDPKLAERAGLWHLAARLADKRGMKARQMECLERALETEYRDLPEVFDLKALRGDYEKLLGHYQALAEATTALRVAPPADFRERVIRAADRWRALDNGSADACKAAAAVLRILGDRDLAWEYLTTPVGLKPNEADPWANLAGTLQQQGELDLADRAFAAAFESEPTNARYLWDRAQNLRQAGKHAESKKLLRQLADGKWHAGYQRIQAEARYRLGQR